jgi:hypothetical protein
MRGATLWPVAAGLASLCCNSRFRSVAGACQLLPCGRRILSCGTAKLPRLALHSLQQRSGGDAHCRSPARDCVIPSSSAERLGLFGAVATHLERTLSMTNWRLTLPQPPRPSSLHSARASSSRTIEDMLEDLRGWSIPELLRGERDPVLTPAALAEPAPSTGERTEPAAAASQPGWLADAQWQPTPGRLPALPPPVELDPFERAAIRTRRSVIPIIRTDERLPSGRHRIRNEGTGLSRLQDPSLPSWYIGPLDRFTRYLWEAQSDDNINRAHRNSRYVNRAHRNFRNGLPLE